MSNAVTVTGNLTREPEIRYTRDGQASVLLGVAVNRRWQDRETHEWEEATSFFDVICWRDLAENVAMSLIMASPQEPPGEVFDVCGVDVSRTYGAAPEIGRRLRGQRKTGEPSVRNANACTPPAGLRRLWPPVWA